MTDTTTDQKNSTSLPKTAEPPTKTPRKRGRPKKTDLAAKKKPGKVGRPKGDSAIMNDYKARMLNSPKSRRVLEAIFDAALDPEHKNQSAAWKLIMDRIAPSAMFEKEVLGEGSSKPTIQINIQSAGETSISQGNTYDNEEEIIDQEP
jgi:hypothetical protein